jgi:hypothetical protein
VRKTRKHDSGLLWPIIYVVAGLYILGTVATFFSDDVRRDAPAASSGNSLTIEYSATPTPALAPAPTVPPSYRSRSQGYSNPSVPPAAVVDGVVYSRDEQITAMTQAARDAGMNEATAQRVGQQAAALCNGNPDCLR